MSGRRTRPRRPPVPWTLALALAGLAVLWAPGAGAQEAEPAPPPEPQAVVAEPAPEATSDAAPVPAPENPPAGEAAPATTAGTPIEPSAPPAAAAPEPIPAQTVRPTPPVRPAPVAPAQPAPPRASAPAAAPKAAPQAPVASVAPAAAPAGPHADIAAAWRAVMEAADGDDPGRLNGAVSALAEARDAEGLDNLQTAAQALAGWAHEAVDAGAFSRAERLSRAAVRLGPGDPEGHLVRARMYWAQGHYGAASAWALRGAAVGLAHPWVGVAWVGYLAIVFWVAAASVLVVLLVPSLWTALRTFHHQVSEYAGFRVPAPVVGAACVAVLCLPVAGAWGLGWTIVAWALLAWAGDPARGRRVHLLLLLVVLLGPWLCAPALAPSRPADGTLALALAEGTGARPVAGQSVPRVAPDEVADWRVALALGNAALRSGNFDRAIDWYEAAGQRGGDPVRLAHNIATAHFRAGRFEEAERRFRALADGGRAPARTLFNLGQAQSRRLDFDGARDSFDRARQANADEYLRISRVTSDRGDFLVVPFGVTRGDLRALQLGGAGDFSDFAGPLWRFLFGSLSMALAPVLMAALAALAWLLPALVTRRRVYSCDVCRGSVCQECMQFLYDVHLCRACVARLAGTRGTLADVTMMRERRRPMARPLLRLAERVVPGMMDLRRGRYGRASFHLMLLSALVWGLVLLSTIPAWAVSVPVEGWPVARLTGTLLVLVHMAWTWRVTGRRQVVAPLVERRKRPRRTDSRDRGLP